MSTPCSTSLSKGKVSTGNTQTDAILEQVRSLLTADDMAAHFYRMHRIFETKHKADLIMSDNGIVNQNNDHAPPTALGPAEGRARDIDGAPTKRTMVPVQGLKPPKNERPGM